MRLSPQRPCLPPCCSIRTTGLLMAEQPSQVLPGPETDEEGIVEFGGEPTTTATPTLAIPPGLKPSSVIDLFIELGWRHRQINPSPQCTDAAFVRRIHLDLVGRIPTRHEAREFLDDTKSDKRGRLIDALLNSGEYGRHMSEVFDAVLMGRRGAEKRRERMRNGWFKYLAVASMKTDLGTRWLATYCSPAQWGKRIRVRSGSCTSARTSTRTLPKRSRRFFRCADSMCAMSRPSFG